MIEAWRTLLYCDEDHEAKNTRDPVAPATRSKEALQKVHTKRLEDGSRVHSFQTLLFHLSALVRNPCRRRDAGADELSFDVDTTPNAKEQEVYDLLARIKV